MNDIEILEKLKVTLTMHHLGGAEAIENLIQRNKDLEQIKKEDLKMLNEGWKIECEKKDKTIDLMAEEMVNGVYLFKSKNQVIDYFTNKVEEDK